MILQHDNAHARIRVPTNGRDVQIPAQGPCAQCGCVAGQCKHRTRLVVPVNPLQVPRWTRRPTAQTARRELPFAGRPAQQWCIDDDATPHNPEFAAALGLSNLNCRPELARLTQVGPGHVAHGPQGTVPR